MTSNSIRNNAAQAISNSFPTLDDVVVLGGVPHRQHDPVRGVRLAPGVDPDLGPVVVPFRCSEVAAEVQDRVHPARATGLVDTVAANLCAHDLLLGLVLIPTSTLSRRAA